MKPENYETRENELRAELDELMNQFRTASAKAADPERENGRLVPVENALCRSREAQANSNFALDLREFETAVHNLRQILKHPHLANANTFLDLLQLQ